MPSAWWITDENGLPIPDGRIIANTFSEADKILFYRMCNGLCPVGCSVIEEAIDEVEDGYIISIEDQS